jgi:hypothetical protein
MRLGETHEARQALAAVGRILDEQRPMFDGSAPGKLWHDWLWLSAPSLRAESGNILILTQA